VTVGCSCTGQPTLLKLLDLGIGENRGAWLTRIHFRVIRERDTSPAKDSLVAKDEKYASRWRNRR
jgi:hypothetical protein